MKNGSSDPPSVSGLDELPHLETFKVDTRIRRNLVLHDWILGWLKGKIRPSLAYSILFLIFFAPTALCYFIWGFGATEITLGEVCIVLFISIFPVSACLWLEHDYWGYWHKIRVRVEIDEPEFLRIRQHFDDWIYGPLKIGIFSIVYIIYQVIALLVIYTNPALNTLFCCMFHLIYMGLVWYFTVNAICDFIQILAMVRILHRAHLKIAPMHSDQCDGFAGGIGGISTHSALIASEFSFIMPLFIQLQMKVNSILVFVPSVILIAGTAILIILANVLPIWFWQKIISRAKDDEVHTRAAQIELDYREFLRCPKANDFQRISLQWRVFDQYNQIKTFPLSYQVLGKIIIVLLIPIFTVVLSTIIILLLMT